MANSKITALTAITEITDSDLLPVVSDMLTTPVTRKITASNLLSGWIKAPAWSYASASTFTISGDYTSVYKKGLRIRWTQTTVKYGVVASSSYSAPNTTVTIAVNTDYVITNAAITARAYSFLENPIDWPCWFSYATTVTSGTGALTSYTVGSAKWSANQREARILLDITITNNGTGATSIIASSPISATAVGIGNGREIAAVGFMLQTTFSGAEVKIYKYDNAYPAANGYRLICNANGLW